jgi:hypothetical protein
MKCPTCGAKTESKNRSCSYCGTVIERPQPALNLSGITCPGCLLEMAVPIDFSEAKRAKITCQNCAARVLIDSGKGAQLLGPNDRPYSPAEDPELQSPRLCSSCRHSQSPLAHNVTLVLLPVFVLGLLFCYGYYSNWLEEVSGRTWIVMSCGVTAFAAIGLLWQNFARSANDYRCANRQCRIQCGSSECHYINPNCRCKYWDK